MTQGTLPSLIALHAQSAPDAIAMLSPDRAPLRFGALARQMSDTAELLATFGFGRGHRVAIALPNGLETAVAMLAVIDCATCVPMNPNADAATARDLCERLRVDAVIVGDADAGGEPNAFCRVAAELGLPVITLTCTPADPANAYALHCDRLRAPVPVTSASSEDIALVLHTSGTTGRSKGVALTHGSQYASALQRIELFGLGKDDRSLCVTPFFTATALRRNLFPPLAVGGSVVCLQQFDAAKFLDWLPEFEPTFYAASPAVHHAVAEAIARRGGVPRHKLRFIVSGSAALPGNLQMRLEEAFGIPLIQTYAMTETGAIAQNPLPPGMRRMGSVGFPAHCEVAIIDDDGNPLAAGESGEIVVRGPQVFGGYEDDPDANRRAFIDGWFRTGDLGYRDADGYLHVSGRLKEIINRGGLKVSPAEVDNVLIVHPAVREAATFGVAHPTLGEDVVAAVVLRDGTGVTMQALRDHVFAHLAEFKVPTRVVAVAEIPRSVSGKLRRHELASALPPPRPAYVAPRDEREATVAALFATVLGVESVGAFDNFFALGGDSLSGAQIAARANTAFNRQVTAAMLFRRPTVAEFAAEIDAAASGGDTASPPPIAPIRRNTGTPQGGEDR